MNPWSLFCRDEQFLYDYWLALVATELPEHSIEQFHATFITGANPLETGVQCSLERIVRSTHADEHFKYILNRSSYIFINHWRMEPKHHPFVHELVKLLEQPPNTPTTAHVRKLQALRQRFLETEEYFALQRYILCTVAPDSETTAPALQQEIRRYPYLYEHTLLTNSSDGEQRQMVEAQRRQAERKLELELSQYIAYRRLRQYRTEEKLAAHTSACPPPPTRSAGLNPTLLSDRQLCNAFHQFSDSTHNSHRSLAHQFRKHTQETRNYRTFKAELHDFLTLGCSSYYIGEKLAGFLKTLYSDRDSFRPNRELEIRTCQRVLSFLLVESHRNFDDSNFQDVLRSLGHDLAIGLVLRIVLFCQQAKPWMEGRFALLFKHHETKLKREVHWLIETFEYLNVALTINFGTQPAHQWKVL